MLDTSHLEPSLDESAIHQAPLDMWSSPYPSDSPLLESTESKFNYKLNEEYSSKTKLRNNQYVLSGEMAEMLRTCGIALKKVRMETSSLEQKLKEL